MIATYWPEMLAIALCGLVYAGFRLGHEISLWRVMVAGLVSLPLWAAAIITHHAVLAGLALAWNFFLVGLVVGNRCPLCRFVRLIKELRQLKQGRAETQAGASTADNNPPQE